MRLGQRVDAHLLVACWLAAGALGCGKEPGSVVSISRDGGAGADGDAGANDDDASIDGDASIEGGVDPDRDGGSDGQVSGTSGVGGTAAASGGAGGESGGAAMGGAGGSSGVDGGSDPDGGGAGEGGNAAPPDAVCFGGGDQASASGNGECATPFVIDMRSLEYGDVVFHETGNAAINGEPPSIGKCAAETQRDLVYNVRLPAEADLEVSVDGADGADPTIVAQEGPDAECDKKAATECVDDMEAGACEYLRIRSGSGGYDSNTPQIVIAEAAASSASYVVRFRLVDPGGGS